MNWIEGTDLQQALEDEGDPGLPLQEVIDDLTHVADALDHLHAHVPPVVHGDVKPANLVRTDSGRVVLVDFDIAGADAASDRVGTIGFVAPEVAAGEKPGPAADVFGLAATALTLLDGRQPNETAPRYSNVEPSERGDVARVLRAALASDPARRPRSAGRVVASLRRAGRDDLPSGVVALLAAEVADSSRLWREDADEMRVAMARLRDVRDEVVGRRGGRVVTSMNEGDRTIAVFREASSAALASLEVHDRIAGEQFPPGFAVRVRAALAVGDAVLSDGVYTGAVVDQVLWLRSMAEPGTTLMSESTAELIVPVVGRDASIVPLGRVVTAALPDGAAVFGLTRPGAEHKVRIDTARPVAPAPQPKSDVAAADAAPSRRDSIVYALQHPSTLVSIVVVGLAAIFLFVLAAELGMAIVAESLLVVGMIAVVGSFAWRYTRAERSRARQIERTQRERDSVALAHASALTRADARARLESQFAGLESDDADEGARVLAALGDTFEAVTEVVRRGHTGTPENLATLLPDLAQETYDHGMSALSGAVELFEFAGGQGHRRLVIELEEVERRLAADAYTDSRARSRDQDRLTSHRQLLDRHREAHQRACDLMFEAERCSTALAEARIELASARRSGVHGDVDTVVHTLQATIRHVREVQDELRSLGY
jgi:Protein kinase domain